MKYKVIGLMSGTSLDGLDITFCEFSCDKNRWEYRILCAGTVPYPEPWRIRLARAENGSALDLAMVDSEYGHYTGELTREFIERHGIQPDFIASHGHTVFHRPERHMTCQIGSGPAIAAETGLPVVFDFRSGDVALGGQGAPLVPAGDRLLFASYDFCLNIGGFANVSYEKDGNRLAFDICPANIVLNDLAMIAGHRFDPGGSLARNGNLNQELLDRLNSLDYYRVSPPKSLGKEWVMAQVNPLISEFRIPTADLLATFSEHVARQISAATRTEKRDATLLITGGGAWNEFLVERIRFHAGPAVVIPDADTVNFKEALIFAFLGVLRMRNENNCLKSVTGASRDSSQGTIC